MNVNRVENQFKMYKIYLRNNLSTNCLVSVRRLASTKPKPEISNALYCASSVK